MKGDHGALWAIRIETGLIITYLGVVSSSIFGASPASGAEAEFKLALNQINFPLNSINSIRNFDSGR